MDAVEEIKQRLNIEDVIGEYVELKRAGRNFKGLSPFGNERTPSFMVSPEKQIWHDFSSSKGGNMFSFVMEMEGLDFRGALELLARKAGVDLSQYGGGNSAERGKHRERVLAALEQAAHFYQVQFSKHRPALQYILQKRQFTKPTALLFRLGYAPNQGDALVKFLTGKGFTLAELKAAGLSAQRYRGGVGDMFRGRIMVPLMDGMGQVIGFTARLLEDDPSLVSEAPKYLNTPATQVYNKSRHVFGLHLAKDAIRKQNYAVVVEGNLDVIASHQAGVQNVVATAGTAVTEAHLKALGRFTPDIRVSFDQDNAGLQATERAIPIASKVGVNLSIITIPSGKDPDELVRSDPAKWRQIIEQPEYALDWLIGRYQAQLDLTSGAGKRQFSDVLLKVIRALDDQVEQDHYLIRIAEVIQVSPDALRAKLHQGTRPQTVKRRTTTPAILDKTAIEYIKTQNQLLALALMRSELREYLAHITPDMLPQDPARAVLEYLQQHPNAESDLTKVRKLREFEDYGKMITLYFEELYRNLELLELRYEAARMQAHLIEQYVKIQKDLLAEQLRSATDSQADQLLSRVKQLDSLLSSVSSGGIHVTKSKSSGRTSDD